MSVIRRRWVLVPTYFLAIGHRETFLAYAYQAYEIFVRAEKILFTTADGSTKGSVRGTV